MQLTPVQFTAARRSGRRPVVHPGGASADDLRRSTARERGHLPSLPPVTRSTGLPKGFKPPVIAARAVLAERRAAEAARQAAFDQGRLFLLGDE